MSEIKVQEFHQLSTTTDENAIKWRDEVNTIQSDGWFSQIEKYDPEFTGYVWRLSDRWQTILPLDEFTDRPICYLEIGTLCGANLISVAKTYASHPGSRIDCIDMWKDTPAYSEYKCLQDSNYMHFLSNIDRNKLSDKVTIYKDYSYNVLPTLPNDKYDIIYIDANHESWAVLEDGVHAFRKCKPDGWLVFDDYTFSKETQRGIDCFLNCFEKYIEDYWIEYGQVYVHLCKTDFLE